MYDRTPKSSLTVTKMENLIEKKNERIFAFDVIRIIAVLAVIMIHVCNPLIKSQKGTFAFYLGNVFDSISQLGVPLFLMISGALMLNQNKSLPAKTIYFKHIKNLLLLIIFWAFIYAMVYQIIYPAIDGQAISIKEFLKSILLGQFHMWYLYMLVGLYAITPILRCITTNDNKNKVLLLIGLCLLFTFVQSIIIELSTYHYVFDLIAEFINLFKLGFISEYIAYYLIGWYVVRIGLSQKQKRYIYLFGGLSIAVIILYVGFTASYSIIYSSQSLFMFLYSLSIFVLLNNINYNKIENSKFAKAVITTSKLTFGVYIVHIFFWKSISNALFGLVHPILFLIITFLSTAILSFVFCYLISKMPYVKKIIRG